MGVLTLCVAPQILNTSGSSASRWWNFFSRLFEMFATVAKRLFGSANDRFIKGLDKTVNIINDLEPSLESLSDTDLKARTGWLKERLAAGESLDDLLPDAFATVREAAKRTLGQRHFDVQIKGGVVLHRGMISEMKTGEG